MRIIQAEPPRKTPAANTDQPIQRRLICWRQTMPRTRPITATAAPAAIQIGQCGVACEKLIGGAVHIEAADDQQIDLRHAAGQKNLSALCMGSFRFTGLDLLTGFLDI